VVAVLAVEVAPQALAVEDKALLALKTMVFHQFLAQKTLAVAVVEPLVLTMPSEVLVPLVVLV
jgi:hypothetical protein